MSFAYNPITITGAGGGAGGLGGANVAASGAPYTSIAQAIASSWNVVNVVGYTAESGNINVPSSGLYVNLYNNAVLDLGTNSFQVETGERLLIEGEGTIRFGNVAGGTLFNGSGALHVENVTISNTGNFAICFTNMDYARVDSVEFNGDVRLCGDFNIFSDSIYRDGVIYITDVCDNSAIHGAVLDSTLIIDSGNNSVVSDILNG